METPEKQQTQRSMTNDNPNPFSEKHKEVMTLILNKIKNFEDGLGVYMAEDDFYYTLPFTFSEYIVEMKEYSRLQFSEKDFLKEGISERVEEVVKEIEKLVKWYKKTFALLKPFKHSLSLDGRNNIKTCHKAIKVFRGEKRKLIVNKDKCLQFLERRNEQSGEDESKNIEQGQNNSLLSAIKKNLSAFEFEFNNGTDYSKANEAVKEFFLGTTQPINKPVFIKNGNIKNLAFALGEIWRSRKNEPITFEYLQFYKKTFSIFGKQKIDKRNVFGCNLYKYSISKT